MVESTIEFDILLLRHIYHFPYVTMPYLRRINCVIFLIFSVMLSNVNVLATSCHFLNPCVILFVGIRILVTLLLDTLPMLGNVLVLSFLIFFVFGIVSVQLWQGKLRNRCFTNFTDDSAFFTR